MFRARLLIHNYLCYPLGMTTQTADDPATDYLMTKCRHCDGPVARRRPSLSGAHFCTRPECVRAKARFYNQRRSTNREAAELAQRQAEARDDLIIAVITAVAAGERGYCSDCTRKDVLPGFGHPNPDWTAPCPGGGGAPYPSGLGDRIAKLLWPPA
jgi:hypothetical protein